MRFTLIYDGPLPSQAAKSGRADDKHRIREQLHPQLVELWKTHPANQFEVSALDRSCSKGRGVVRRLRCDHYQCGEFRFVPLVTKAAHLICELDILFLREEAKGNVVNHVNHYGDLDNRLKVLFDALRMPENPREIPEAAVTQLEDPFFCLLETDSLITGFRVTSERLLEPHGTDDRSRVRLVINVNVKILQLTYGNMEFGGD